ncbi:MAG: hypothetical protein J5755_03500 [Clostridia bacterium]|nr:hypothetical protein [Clostridia bacterium]
MKRVFLILTILLFVVTMALPSVLATADGGERLHEIVEILSAQLEAGGDYPLHAAPDPEVSTMTDYYHQLIYEGFDLIDEGAEEDVQALRWLAFVYDKEEARLKLYVDSTQLQFGMTRSSVNSYWEEEWAEIAALLLQLDQDLAAADDYDSVDAAFARLRAGVEQVPTYDQIYRGWVNAVDAYVNEQDALWLGTINAALAAFDMGEASLSPFSVEISLTYYSESVEALSKYYSREDWASVTSAHDAMLAYFLGESDYHARYEETPTVVTDWQTVLGRVTVLLDADEVNMAIALRNARAALALYLEEDFLSRYDADERARIIRAVEQSYVALEACTTPNEVAAVVSDCGKTIKAGTRKTLSKTTIIAIVLGVVAVVLFILYFVFKYFQSRKTKHVDAQVFLAGLAKEIEEAKAKEAERQAQEEPSAEQEESSQEEPAEPKEDEE